MENTTEYKCPSCGGVLNYDPGLGKLKCGSCGNEYDVEAMDAYYKTPDANDAFDWDEFRKTSKSAGRLDDVNVYVCQSCGAVIEADKNTVATACPYCGNNVILNDKLDGGERPNVIIPFKIMPPDLPSVIRGFCKGKHLLPNGFFSENKIGKLQGIYVPFWLYDCHMDGEIMLNAVRIRHYRQGKYDCTSTSHFLLERDGEMSFSHIPVDASERMDDDLMDSIEPFDFSELVDFDAGYLSGFLADRFDTDPDTEILRATKRIKNSAAQAYSQTAHLYTGVSIHSNNVKIDKASVKYAMLPVYLLNCTYRGKNYRYAINGQTGKVVGELPISKKKMLAWGAGVGGAVFILIFIIMILLMGGTL